MKLNHTTIAAAALLACLSLAASHATAADDSVTSGRHKLGASASVKLPSPINAAPSSGGVTSAAYVGVLEGMGSFTNTSGVALQLTTQARGGCVDLRVNVSGQPAGEASNDCEGVSVSYPFMVPPGAAFSIGGVAQGNDVKSYVTAFGTGVTLTSLGWVVMGRGTQYATNYPGVCGVVAPTRSWIKYSDGRLIYSYQTAKPTDTFTDVPPACEPVPQGG